METRNNWSKRTLVPAVDLIFKTGQECLHSFQANDTVFSKYLHLNPVGIARIKNREFAGILADRTSWLSYPDRFRTRYTLFYYKNNFIRTTRLKSAKILEQLKNKPRLGLDS